MGVTLGWLYRSLVKIGLFNVSSQIEPKGLKFSVFDGGHPWVIKRKCGEDQSKTLPLGWVLLYL